MKKSVVLLKKNVCFLFLLSAPGDLLKRVLCKGAYEDFKKTNNNLLYKYPIYFFYSMNCYRSWDAEETLIFVCCCCVMSFVD